MMHVALALIAACFVPCAARAAEPTATARSLTALQAQIATGRAVPAAQAARLRDIAADFAAQPHSVWARSANAQALAVFIFAGGNPDVARRILVLPGLPEVDARLIKAALVHAEGVGPAARDALAALDIRALPADIGGHVALALATHIAADDRPAALARLDEARLLSPGSLVEEASLRRTMFLLSGDGEASAFADAVRRYRTRFSSSAYAENFERRVAESLTTRWPRASEVEKTHFIVAFDGLQPQPRAAAWLATARRALVEAIPTVAGEAAARALREPGLGEEDRRRADRILAIARLFTGRVDEAVQWLRSNPVEATSTDRDFIRAALLVADNIQAPMPRSSHDAKAHDSASDVERVIARGETLLAARLP